MMRRVPVGIFLVVSTVGAADSAGLACPIPRALHPPSSDASLRAAKEKSQRRPDCCGVVINQVKYSAAGVICWPVAEGDTVQAQGWPTAIVLNDGGRVYLSEGSRLQVESTAIRMMTGTAFWKIPVTSKRRMASANDKQPMNARQGMGQIRDGKLMVTEGRQMPDVMPETAELIRRFEDASGRLIPTDGP